MSKYIEFRKGLGGKSRDCIIKLEDLPTKVDPYVDCYRSLFYHDEGILKHVTDHGSITGYRGKAGVDRLVWDFDNLDLEISRADTIALVDKLINEYGVKESEIGVLFSGNKGFNVEIKVKGIPELDGVVEENIPLYVKKLCLFIAGDIECDRVIYNHNRLYRVPGTLHQKESKIGELGVRLFKTSIPVKMLREAPVDLIKKYCIEMRLPQSFEALSDTSKVSETLDKIIKNVDNIARQIGTNQSVRIKDGLADVSQAPRGVKTCIWQLMQGKYTESRDNALLRIADHEKKQGKPARVVFATLKGVLSLMNDSNPQKAKLDPITDNDLQRIVKQAYNNEYDYGCYDPILDAVCSKKCYLAPRKFNESKVNMSRMDEAYARAKSFYEKYYENVVPTGLSELDNNMPLFLGTFNLIVGRPGTGKTSLMLNIMKNASKSDMSALFFSMDMSEEMLLQRCAPILLASSSGRPTISGKEFMQAHARKDMSIMADAQKAFESVSENVLISSKRSLTVSDISSEIDRQEAMLGKKVKLVIVDYVQLLKSDHADGSYQNHTYNAEALTQLAKEKRVCLLGLSQSPRGGGDSGVMAKGSGAWEEQASTQINCFRPFRDTFPQFDFIMTVSMAKNRLGATTQVDLHFHGPSGVCRDLTEEEQETLVSMRDEIDHEK